MSSSSPPDKAQKADKPDKAETPSGNLRDGRYVVLAQLGEGAQGTTWDAVDKREGRPVAIKQFDVRGARAWKDVELAEREARVLASLSHAKLPAYVEHFEENGVLYLVMEKIEGTPVSVLRKRGAMREEDVVRLLRDADDVLAYLHGRAPPVVHRDLKPSNVIRRPDGSFAFVDFGAVRDRMRPEGGSTVVGTFGYMAPEQFQGRAGPGSDVYAIGATALSLLTGEEPEKLPHRGLAIDVDAALAGRGSKVLRDALVRMLEPNPDTRPTRIGPLLAGLRRRSASPPARSERSQHAERPDERARRGRPRFGDFQRDLGREIRDHVEREIREGIHRAARRGDPRAERWAKHQQKRAEKRARKYAAREARRQGRHFGPPWFVLVVISLALTLAQVAVALALRVVVPMILMLLSIAFGRALRHAARNVSEAGVRARAAIERARVYMHSAGDEGEIRVDRTGDGEGADEARDAAAPAKRVAADGDGDEDEAARVRVAEDGADFDARLREAEEERERDRERDPDGSRRAQRRV